MESKLFNIAEEIRKCTSCPLWKGRLLAVPGDGPETAKVMVIGEGPGADEDRLGKPFVGRAGKFLSQLLEDNHINRNDIYITNCVKCRPPNNRDPSKKEMQSCKKWLDQQIQIIQPELIIILGRVALKNLLQKEKISDYNGKIMEENNQKYFITYHPSAGIRMVKWKVKLEEDFKKLGEIYEKMS